MNQLIKNLNVDIILRIEIPQNVSIVIYQENVENINL